jgi:mannose-6-phosphate isomerase-like protein (cupin superfamily)
MEDSMEQTITTSWQQRVKYGSEGPEPQVLADDGQMKVVLVGLRSGQAIPPHPEGKSVFNFLEGEGLMTVNDETFPVSPGMTVVIPPGGRRGIQATTQLAFLAIRIVQ